MTMLRLRISRPEDGDRVVQIWRDAVDATHDFLSPDDRIAIEEQVSEFLPRTPLWLAVDELDEVLGFMLLDEGSMEALFIDPAHHGKGVGRMLVEHALSTSPKLVTSVNEQNAQALSFYRQLGFVVTGRSPMDDQGRPYPLLQMKFGPA